MSAADLASAPARRAAAAPGADRAQAGDLVLDRRGPLRPERLAPSRARVHGRAMALSFRIIDGVIMAAVASAALLVTPEPVWLTGAACIAAFAAPLWALGSLRAYGFKPGESLARHLARVTVAFAVTSAMAAVLLTPWITLQDAGELPIGWFLVGFYLVLLAHALAWRTVKRARAQGRLTANIVIVGAGKNAERLIAAALASGDVSILGIFDDRAARAPKAISGVPVLGDMAALLSHKIMPAVDKVVIAVPEAARTRVRELIERLNVLPNPIALYVEDEDAPRPETLARVAGAPLVYVSGEPDDIRRAIVKRGQDIVVGAVALIIALPIMVITALAVRLDSPGPILFRQKRHGFNNEEIVVWKFRSMRVEMSDARATRQVQADDDRVTRVGRFIRATSLDELPQIFNVLKGEMSLVGPRPHAIGMMTGDVESARLVAQYAHRHRMKPGMTGWAAIHGSRGPVDTPELVRERVAFDVEYIERQSFWLDLYIMAMTIPCLLGDSRTVR